MKSESIKQVKDVLYANQPASRNFKQEFQYGDQLITYQHHVTNDLEIRNQLTVQREASLEKVTEILLENRLIKIIDTFQSLTNPSLLSNQGLGQRWAQKVKKFTIFKEREGQEAHKGKDTKNVVKNIVRLFQSWLQDDLPTYKPLFEQLDSIVEKTKFNNNLIMQIIKHQSLRIAFLHFARQDAQNFIRKSKIHDKKTHVQALEKYHNLFQMETNREIEQLRVNISQQQHMIDNKQ